MEKQYVFLFGEGLKGKTITQEDKLLLGGKGANLGEMTRIGLPVPAGFTITTEACNYFSGQHKWPDGLKEQVNECLVKLEKKTGKKFGSEMLVSVRSGSAFSMPGMMDTILNLGLNDNTVKNLVKKTDDERFAYDCYRRLLQMFGNVVLEVEHEKFEHILESYKKGRRDVDINADELKKIVDDYKKLIKQEAEKEFPQDPMEQLKLAINAVFQSWNNKRAVTYRKLNKIADDLGTAVNIQEMVFGNMGNDSGTGVAFTRNPATGEKEYYGEYLINAQGEDVVAGIRTPHPIKDLAKDLPECYKELIRVYHRLEEHYRDVQDFEFTIEKNKLFILQTRTGKRTATAAVKIAVDMVKEGIIDKKTAVLRIDPNQLNQLLHRRIDPKAKPTILAKGIAASPGAASGEVVFDADVAVEEAEAGKKVMLVRPETTPEDIHGLNAAQGVVTSRGGTTSHAAVVARGMGKPCVAGCGDVKINIEKKVFVAGNHTVKGGDIITIDGSTGEVMLGAVPTIEPKLSSEFNEILKWADEFRKLDVMANGDTPIDALKAKEFGAQGIGLCRTEHMFFAEDRIPVVRAMIMSETEEERRQHLDKLLPMQKEDFLGILEAMDGLPVTIRLIDPPLHEFLPSAEELIEEVTRLKCEKKDAKEKEALLHKVKALQEMNPMLGLRGCRLGIVYPEIVEMQARAIIEAAVELKKKGKTPKPEIMIPLVGMANELRFEKEIVEKTAKDVMEKAGIKIEYKIGTMIELPRAALTADKVAKYAEFFSFGTNDLTQTTFGFSRDDVEGKFFKDYFDKKIMKEDPFINLDQEGVGKLVKMGVELGRKTKPGLKVGICGEHGGDPQSVEFCHRVGLTYVSCSPFRVPIARLAAAQAALKTGSDHYTTA